MAESLAYLALSKAKGIGPRKLKLLLAAFSDAEGILRASRESLLRLETIGPSIVRSIREASKDPWPQQELTRAKALGIDILHINHKDYPAYLRQIYDPPAVLYVRGHLPTFSDPPKSIAIVGSRNASDHALEFAHGLAKSLAEAGIMVVSGLALGVDTAAHSGSLTGQGKTLAVLGSGIDVVYPSKNQHLAKKIASGGGALVSEYPIGTRPHARNFPGRNRIISGLSRGIVVIEASKKSGALITADFALEEGRTVFAVPGRVNDSKAKGSNFLLKQGANLLTESADIFLEFSWSHTSIRSSTVQLPPAQKTLLSLFDRLEQPLLDDLVYQSNMTVEVLLPLLSILELKGMIKKLPNGRYISCQAVI